MKSTSGQIKMFKGISYYMIHIPYMFYGTLMWQIVRFSVRQISSAHIRTQDGLTSMDRNIDFIVQTFLRKVEHENALATFRHTG